MSAPLNIDMSQLDEADCRFWLTQAMARTAGVNLSTHLATGDLTVEGFERMVARCTACQKAEPCVRWLAEGAPGAPELPSYCLNHEIIEALRTLPVSS